MKNTSTRPRLAVFRSNKSIYAQIIDDEQGKTLAAACEKNIKKDNQLNKSQKASLVGEVLAKKAIDLKIVKVRFDRRQYKYHGRIKALADGAKKGGLDF